MTKLCGSNPAEGDSRQSDVKMDAWLLLKLEKERCQGVMLMTSTSRAPTGQGKYGH